MEYIHSLITYKTAIDAPNRPSKKYGINSNITNLPHGVLRKSLEFFFL
jgi:hypothetical protein